MEAQHLEIFEIDHPATQSLKKMRLAECGLSVSSRVHFVSADLAVEQLGEILSHANFDPHLPAFFSWLGVTDRAPSAAFAEVQKMVTAMGEPFLSGFDPATLAADLRAVGLELEEDVGEPQLVHDYDPVNINSLHPVAELHTARARVTGSPH